MVKSKKKQISKNKASNSRKAPIRIKREKSSSLKRNKIKSESTNRIRGLRNSRKDVKSYRIISKSPLPKKKKKEERFIPLYEQIDSEDISETSEIEIKEEEEIINTNVRPRNKSRSKNRNKSGNRSTIKRSDMRLKSSSTQKYLNQKKSYSTSKARISSKNKRKKYEPEEIEEIEEEEEQEEPEEVEEQEEEEDVEQIEEEEESSYEEKKKKSKKIKKEKKSNSTTKIGKKSKKINIEDLNIDDYDEDNSLTIKNHNIIEDCCLACNEKNIFRAIKTNDKELFNKCLRDTKKISSLDYKLQIIGGLTPIEYIIKEKNKKLYTEFVNFNKNPIKQRVEIPKDKLSYMNTGKTSIYTFGFNTRPIGLSRGNKLGNNAFIVSSYNEDFSTGYQQIVRKFISYTSSKETILFHDDEDFINFNTFAKHQELSDYIINNLLNENIDKGNISIVEYLLSVFTSKEVYNYNKLHQLVTVQKPGAEKNLEIKNKMSANKNNNLHVTPVHLACINPNEKILEEVLNNGGETEFQDNMGRKPISYAATCKGPGPLKVLIKRKCNVNDREKAGFTPIIHACRTGRYENVKLLLENGADPMQKPRPGQCMAIHFACMKDTDNNLKILKLLLDKKPELLNINGSGKKSPLHFAVIYNCPRIVEFLVKRGAKINQSDKYVRSPLLLSCKYGYSKITKYLIDCGANIKKCDNSQNSPLHYACAFGNLECVKILLDHGADINCLNMWKNLPIEIALLKNHFGIVQYLINNDKFSVDTHFGNGNTILLFYLLDIDESTFEKIKYIIEGKKGDGNISNSNKMNSFHFLTHFSYRAYLSTFVPLGEKQKLTEEKHKNIYHPQYIAILKKYINFFKDNGCEVDLENNIGQTPLMLALKNKNFDFAQIFIELFKNEINIKHVDKNGFNVFDYAFKDGASLTDECLKFTTKLFEIYKKDIDSEFLCQYTRYGRNSLLNLCEDYALHIYEKFYFINKRNTLDYIRKETKEEENNGKKQKKYKLIIPLKYKKTIFKKSYKELKEFIEKKFYPLIEEFIKKGCNINCHTEEKKFKNKSKEFEDYKYFNNYGKIYPIMYLISYPESEGLINLIKKYKIDINCTDLKNQTLLMYLLEVQKQIKNINKNNYQKIFDYLIENCKNLSAKNSENKNLFITEFEKGNQEESLKIYQELGDKKIDINDPCYKNYLTIIGNAIVNSNENQIEFLLNNFKNINLNKIDIKFNRNALHYICMKDSAKQEIDFKKYEKWLNLGTSLTQKDIFNRNPLFYLFINEKNETKKEDPISTLSYLLDRYNEHNKYNNDLDLNSVDILGNPLIFYAVKSDAVFCVSSLMNRGAIIKNIKNYENNSILSYALLGNSNSLIELYSKINNIKAFEEKIYKINNEPIENALTNAEKRIKNGNMIEENENQKTNEITFCVEELFKSNNYDEKVESKKQQKEIEVKMEEDNNLEQLFKENDEGTSLKMLGNANNKDEFSNYWGKDYYGDYFINADDNSIDNDYDFKEDNSIEIESDDDKDDNIIYDYDSITKEKLPAVKSDIYEFNYCNEIDRLISNYLFKCWGIHNYHYQTNFIPLDNNKIEAQKYPKINCIKYKLPLCPNDKDNKEKTEDESENKILSESLFKYCIEQNYQNVIYYILNQGYDEFQAISDSLSSAKFKFCVVLLERINSISKSKLQIKNNKGQSLLHILCNNKATYQKELIENIYNILTTKINLKINEFDNDMHTPLYYAVLNNNIELINILTDNMNDNKYYLFLEKDKNNANNFSPLMLLYDKILDKSISESNLSSLLKILFKVTKKTKIGYIKNVSKYLTKNYSNKLINVKLDSKNYDGIFTNDSSNLTIIIHLFHYLLNECNADINCDIDDKGNNIFFMSAMKNNLDLFKDILLNKKNINYNQVNNEGKSLIHYIVCPHPLYSYKNIEFLKLSLKAGFNPKIKDKEGLTPLDYAKKYNYEDIIKILSKNNNNKIKEEEMEIEEEDYNESQTKKQIKEEYLEIDNENNEENINYNYNEISDKYYKEKIEPFIQQNVTEVDKSKTLVVQNCGLIISNYHVYKDDNGCLYNTNLSKVDINKYCYGEFLFYQIQLLVNDKKQIYNLITRWGRFGDQGQYQNTPFTDLNEAIKEYNKIFLSKTGNEWDKVKESVDNFERKPKKYYLLKLTEEKPEIYNIIKYFNKELKNIYIKLNKEKFEDKDVVPNNKELIQYLIKISFKNKVENKGYNFSRYNRNYNDESDNEIGIFYFSKESLEKGYRILTELAELNDRVQVLAEERKNQKINEKKLEDENSPYNRNLKEYHEISQKILQLSNTYYEIIPFEEKRNYSVKPINDQYTIKAELERLQSYTYIEDTLKLFLSSLYYSHLIDPINYIYKALHKKLIPLNLDLKSKNNKDKKIVKLLLNYIKLSTDTKSRYDFFSYHNSSNKIITNIFEIFDKNENLLVSNEKRILLFHGTKTQNMLGILSKGLLIAPVESTSSGSRFGSGIYLSDNFEKSLGYCSGGKKTYILIVDTYLDKVFKINKNNKFSNVKDLKAKGYNCLINDATKHISFDDRIYFNNGMTIPTKFIKEEDQFQHSDNDSEYVIYDRKLLNIKYIIELQDPSSF